LLGVETLIDPLVHTQTIPTCGASHELPHALGSSPGHGQGVEAALDHRDESQVFREPLVAEHITDHREVAPRSVQPQSNDVATASGEALDEALHLAVDDDRERRASSNGGA